jgi:lipopolysaccharide/colanic/teichoic acid biosynthesis glycosyltransferase
VSRSSAVTRVSVEPDVVSARADSADDSHTGADMVLRGFDVMIAVSVGAVLLPALALACAAIRVTSGSPVLYRGSRVGRRGVVFTMFKIRTLRPDAEVRLGSVYGEELTRRTEAEVTSLGRWLRASQLDEVPQLWNVLRGDMSIVGPRPLRPVFFGDVSHDIPHYWQRLVVRPGLSGFAQTRMTREVSWAEKLAHDLEYVADRSLGLYMRVVLATAWRVVRQSVTALWDLIRRPGAAER